MHLLVTQYKHHLFTIFLFGLSLITPTLVFATEQASLESAQAAFNKRDYGKAFDIWHKLAIENNSDAQVFVGLAYKKGGGVKKDRTQANSWSLRAAEAGNPAGQYFLGLHYVGSDNPEVVSAGVDMLVKAAENGDRSAKQFLIKARLKRWLDVPSTLNIKATITEVRPVTEENFDEVFVTEVQE